MLDIALCLSVAVSLSLSLSLSLSFSLSLSLVVVLFLENIPFLEQLFRFSRTVHVWFWLLLPAVFTGDDKVRF